MRVHSPSGVPFAQDEEEDQPIEILTNRQTQGANMDATPGMPSGSRRNEDIALDLMRFIAMTAGYGKTGTPGAGFQGGAPARPEECAEHLLELYGRCLTAVQGSK
jgi:hypothetical protein